METPKPAPSVLVLGDQDWRYPAGTPILVGETPMNGEAQITPLDPWVTL